MINLLCLLCSMCIQFAAFSIPYEMSYDDFTLGLMQTFEIQAQSSEDSRILYFADMWKTGEVQYFLFNGNNGNYEIWFDASKYNSSYTSSVIGRIEDNTNSYLQLQLTFNRYYRIVFNPNYTSTLSCSFPNDYGWDDYVFCRVYPYTQDSYKYLYMLNGVVINEGGSPIIYGNYIFIEPVEPEEPSWGNLGALDISGHSSGGSPLEVLGDTSWATMTGHSSGGVVAPSPHSSSTHFNITTQQPNANDSKTDNLLYMLGDKLADITENTSAITSALGGVMYNVMEGASAIFNGISTLNNNVVNFASYLTSVPTSQDISDALDECENIGSLRDLSQSINIWSELGLTQVNSAPTYTFNFNGTMFESMGNFVLNFNFLDSTKNLWQPLLIALLYFNLLVTILTGMPDLIQGRGET